MAKGLMIGALALALAVPAGAQDEKKAEPKQDDAKAALKKALEASSKAGGFKVEGRVDQDNGMGGMKIPGFGDGSLEGKFTGTVGANGTISLKLETDKGTYELYKKGGKLVQRQTWTGKQDMVGSFANEVSAVLTLSRILKQIDKAKNVRTGEVKPVGGVDCTAHKAQLDIGLVPEDEDDDDSGMPIKVKVFELKKVDSTIYAGKDDLVRRVDITLTKGLSSMVRMGGMGGDEEEEEDPKKGDKKGKDEDEGDGGGGIPGMGNFKMSTTYSVTISGYDANLKVEVPEDVKKYLGE